MRPAGESDTDGEGDFEEVRGGVLYSYGARATPPDQGVDLEEDDGLEADDGLEELRETGAGEDETPALYGMIGASEQQLR